jgi:prenyltransferase beta subunit
MHSSLGLAGLALTKTFDLKPLDPSLAISVEARERLERLPWKRRKEER